ncbi:hypothetical protein [Candidatus Poriferisodalis sp.]|uniref:hypothetical protein n=1 Tax=Candidatus Poriferisodalis sp. TaxID=3101277 RepID=UPI003B594691
MSQGHLDIEAVHAELGCRMPGPQPWVALPTGHREVAAPIEIVGELIDGRMRPRCEFRRRLFFVAAAADVLNGRPRRRDPR